MQKISKINLQKYISDCRSLLQKSSFTSLGVNEIQGRPVGDMSHCQMFRIEELQRMARHLLSILKVEKYKRNKI